MYFSKVFKIIIIVGSITSLLMFPSSKKNLNIDIYEYPILICFATIGMMVMVSASSLMTLYMGLELQSLALYVIAAFRRDNAKSTEAGLKYFVLGALSSGILLYGSSLIYGFAGTVKFAGILEATESGNLSMGLLLGLVLVISGLAFK